MAVLGDELRSLII